MEFQKFRLVCFLCLKVLCPDLFLAAWSVSIGAVNWLIDWLIMPMDDLIDWLMAFSSLVVLRRFYRRSRPSAVLHSWFTATVSPDLVHGREGGGFVGGGQPVRRGWSGGNSRRLGQLEQHRIRPTRVSAFVQKVRGHARKSSPTGRNSSEASSPIGYAFSLVKSRHFLVELTWPDWLELIKHTDCCCSFNIPSDSNGFFVFALPCVERGVFHFHFCSRIRRVLATTIVAWWRSASCSTRTSRSPCRPSPSGMTVIIRISPPTKSRRSSAWISSRSCVGVTITSNASAVQQPTNQSINQPINQPINQTEGLKSFNQPINP